MADEGWEEYAEVDEVEERDEREDFLFRPELDWTMAAKALLSADI